MTCAAARVPSPVVLHGKAIGVVPADAVDWDSFKNRPTQFAFTARELIVGCVCWFGIGAALSFIGFSVLFFGVMGAHF